MTKFIPFPAMSHDGTSKIVYLNIGHVLSYDSGGHILTMSNGQTYHITKRALMRVLNDLGIIIPQIVSPPSDPKEEEKNA